MGANLRHQVLLSTTMLVAVLSGYGRRAYGQQVCVQQGTTSTFLCDGSSGDTQDLTYATTGVNNTNVITGLNFAVDTATGTGGNAITITGKGAISYEDYNASSLTAAGIALQITSNGDIAGGNAGSVTVYTNGDLTGSTQGIQAVNFLGSGAVTITANGNVTGTTSYGIYARTSGTGLNVTSGPGTTVTTHGSTSAAILSRNYGNGSQTVTVNGDVTSTGTNGVGIFARNNNDATDLTVTTAAGTAVTSGGEGIEVANFGTGATTVKAYGDVTGTNAGGIYAESYVNATGDLSVLTGAGTAVTGNLFGIKAHNQGQAALSITANGSVTGTNPVGIGIYAQNGSLTLGGAGTDLTVTTEPSTYGVKGGYFGIFARNFGSGATTVKAYGDVEGTNKVGIYARNGSFATGPAGTDMTVISAKVTGKYYGIDARNYGYGALSVTANGDVTATGSNSTGIFAKSGKFGTAYGGDLTVTTGSGTTVSGGDFGIQANNYNSTATTTITANGNVEATTTGIYGRTYGTDLSVTANGTVSGGSIGIKARDFGTGALTVKANGDVTVTAVGSRGIDARNSAAATDDLTVTTGAGTKVSAVERGIDARNYGGAALSVTAKGSVVTTAGDSAAIYAQNGSLGTGSAGTDLTVTTEPSTYGVTGGYYGIVAHNFGSGATTIKAYGDVEGTNKVGINAQNGSATLPAGTDLTVVSAKVTGKYYGIQAHNYGSGVLSVTAKGDVTATGSSSFGIFAQNGSGTGHTGNGLSVTTAAGTTVSGTETGIEANNFGSGATTITANGDVEGTSVFGIYGRTYGTGLDITTAAGTTVSGGNIGIKGRNYGDGALTITANGTVIGTGADGIFAQNDAGSTNVTVITGAGSMVSGSVSTSVGVLVRNFGAGALTARLYGGVAGRDAVNLVNAFGTNLSVTTGTKDITGDARGIYARNDGSGFLTITANGGVTGTSEYGIEALNATGGSYLSITTSSGATIKGGTRGIYARNDGSGKLSITAKGEVTGTAANSTGIFATNGISGAPAGTSLSVTTAAVSGGLRGIDARNFGSGALSVTANGDVTGGTEEAIFARNYYGTGLSLTTAKGTTVSGGNTAIEALNFGSGVLTATLNGNVTAPFTAVDLQNGGSGTNLIATTGPSANGITGGQVGLYARNNGNGFLSITAGGDVTGTSSYGIKAVNTAGTNLTVTTKAGTTVSGGQYGIFAANAGTGTLAITANGNVAGTDVAGIGAFDSGGHKVAIKVGTTGRVTSQNSIGIDTRGAPANITVAGTVTSGVGTAIRFDQGTGHVNRLTLQPTAAITGTVLAGPDPTDTLAFGGSGDGTFDLGKIDTGAGTQQYQNFETFQVDSGTWSFSGVTTEAFTVDGGTLKGTGTFGGLTVNGGTIAPGNSIGTMFVNGAFTLGPGAVYEIETNAQGQSDKVVVKGTVNLTGSVLHVLAASGNYKTKTNYTIVDNDGTDPVVGAFSSITSSLAFLTPTVAYNGGTGNDVVLTLKRNGTLFRNVANTRNQRAVAGALDQFPTDNQLFLDILNQTASGARQAFDALSGEIHATLAGVLADDSRYVREAILGRLMQATYSNKSGQVASLGASGPQVASLDSQAMALGYPLAGDDKSLSAPAPSPLAFWTHAFGAWANFDSDGNAATADRNLGGFVSGVDAPVTGSWRIGVAAGYSKSSLNVDARYSSADVDTFHLAGYAGGQAGPLALRGGGAWAWNTIDTSRAVVFPNFYERENASYDADTGQIFGEAAYPMQMWGAGVEPFAGLAYVAVNTDNWHEHGGSLAALNGHGTDETVGYSTVGLRAAQTMHWESMPVTPHVSAAWQHAFDGVTPDASLAFASTGIGFTVYGVPLAKDSALIDAGFDIALTPNATADVSYSGQFGDHAQDNAVKGDVTWLF